MAIDGDFLYVADTDNQLIRKIDLKNKMVTTIAGTGTIEGFDGAGGDAFENFPALAVGFVARRGRKTFYCDGWLASDLAFGFENESKSNLTPELAGKRAIDGTIGESAFAQPSGIASDGKNLFVADSESNIIREINFQKETVETLVGGDLYDFGDEDGEGDDVRLAASVRRGDLRRSGFACRHIQSQNQSS